MSTDIATEKPETALNSSAPTEDPAATVPVNSERDSTEKDVEMGDDKQKDLLKACRQVEFYFADSNLPYDRFMWTLHTKTPEHWVPISTVASFKRMREHTARGLDWVIKAVRLSEELEMDAEGVNVRRTTEVQEPKDQFERSIYAKGFGDEDSELQGKLEAFFDKYGKTNAVRMRRGEKKVFKSSVFVEFTDFKSVDAFLNADPKPTWEGKELLIMSKQAYCDMKIKEKGLMGKAAVHRKELINRRGFNAFQENNEPERKPASKAEVFLEFMGKKIRVQQDEEGNGTVKEEDVPFVSGASLKFEGCDGQVDFQHIKKSLKDKFSRSPFIKYTKGENHGLVGFDKALSTEEIAYVKETLKTLNDKEITWAVASEEEDKALQIERAQFAARSILTHTQDSRGGRGGGRGGRGGGRGGRGRGGRGGRGGPHGGGRGGSRNRERAAAAGESKAEASTSEEQAGDKRKRAVEPDGGPDVGVRGTNAPPSIQPAKKTKVDSVAAS